MGNVLRDRINIASSYHLDFFGVAPSRTDSGFDTVEVCGSSPHGPTILLNNSWTGLGAAAAFVSRSVPTAFGISP